MTRPAFLVLAAALAACGADKPSDDAWPRKMADGIQAVVAADRAAYTGEVVNRLTKAKVIRAAEHFKDENALPLPAQMLRMGATTVQKGDHGFTYALLSLWPINKQNAARTDVERAGLEQVAKSSTPYYARETLGGKTYYTAVYPDKATSEACVDCHNDSADSPRDDFELGDVMGGLVIRIALP